jgi:GT2 family glycosyltransferase
MEQYCVREGFAGAGNLFVRAATFHRLGGFDESLRSGGDTEFGLRVRAAGGRVHFARRAVVDHPARGASEQMAKARRFAAAKRDRRVRGLAHHRPGEVWRLILPYPRTVLAGLRLRGPLQHRLAAALWAVLIRWYEWWCCVMVIADKRRMRV